MKQHSFYVTMSDGHDLFVRTFSPGIKEIGHVHILHGMAEHSGRYADFAQKLCAAGYFVSAHDHRGHGYTAQKNGMLGYFGADNGFERVVEDVSEVLASLKRETHGRPLLFGHSMGSFIARRFAQRYSESIDRLILSGTASPTWLHEAGNKLARQLVRLQGPKAQGKMMDKLSFGQFNSRIQNAKTPFDWLTTDEEAVQRYIEDPLCGFTATNQFFVDLTDGLAKLKNKRCNECIRAGLRILLISGTDDPVGDVNAKGVLQAGKQLADAGVAHVKVHLFEQMRHEIVHEKKKQHVIEIIVRWLKDE